MKKMFKTSIISLFILAAVTGVAAQPSPPHEIYGDVTDQGTAAQDITVEAVAGSNTYSDSTDSNGYYEIKVPSTESSFDIVVDGSTVETGITVQSGSIANYDFSGDYIEDGGSSDDPDCGDEEYDSDEGECVPVEEEEPVEQPEEDEDQHDQEQEENQQQEEEENQEPVNETVEVQAETDEDNRTSASVNASAGQTVKVNLQQQDEQVGQDGETGQEQGDGSGESQESEADGVSVNSVSATASSDTSVSVSVSEVSDEEVEEPLEDQISYENIEVDGEVSSQTIEFSVSKSRLDEREAGPEQVVKERYSGDEWNQLDTEYLSEGENSYNFEAETSDNSIFATTILERESNIQVTDIDTDVNGTEQELPVTRNISVKVQNRGLGNGSKQVNISVDGDIIHRETVNLEGKSDTRISTTHEFKSGSVDVSAGSISNAVNIQSSENQEGLPLAPIAAVLLVLLLAGIVYKKEQVSDFMESVMTGTEAQKVEDEPEFQGFEEGSEDSELTCDLCGQTFDSVRGLETHHGEVHDDHIFECEECGDRFDTERGLHIHQGQVHGVEEVEVTEGFECGICEKVFDSERGLHIHHGRVHDDEKYRCSQCGKEFESREELHNHQKKH